jgi:hypothetical protein
MLLKVASPIAETDLTPIYIHNPYINIREVERRDIKVMSATGNPKG